MAKSTQSDDGIAQLRADYLAKCKDPRWQKVRLEVFQRDEWTCQVCFAWLKVGRVALIRDVVNPARPHEKHYSEIIA
jgi:5-methylcytosine-specific restriction endonuclease McrA